MRTIRYALAVLFCQALLASAALAASQEEVLEDITRLMFWGTIFFVAMVAVATYFSKSQDKRRSPLKQLFEEGEPIHSVGPDTPVVECVRKMSAEKIGALIVLDGGQLKGIFTERDALNKVLATARDPASTRVAEVMTQDPYCISPNTSVGDAMALITRRRFRHLPVVQDGRLLAVVTSGDLTRWLVKDKVGEVHELVNLASGS